MGASLEGTYHEDGEFGPTNEMLVRVLFDDQSGTVGSFQLAKVATPKQPSWEEGDEPPTPQLQPEPKSAFDFDFRAQSDGRFHLSESRCACRRIKRPCGTREGGGSQGGARRGRQRLDGCQSS